eukprot:Gregarina_sp_Poly_1__6665@NODE_358_length_9258_cov_311_740398_g297_i0_p1_GENE_NODE_358_length_9258_cov_311_740398_g297_i0NODE_358_length_9258_cov_311_740398_g297_i0_p1_ORF_typecomplete_len2374_score363_50C2/PF00168_30/0_00083C2/PF00168_30/1_2e08C2/PF00168_30/5_6e08C2/PF00168_30/0_049C2/PF00168_30/3e11C2/PF00168_30/1_5e11C2/PF00168_30/5_1e07C2/PF00168_30/1e11C2/PF00168_30/0_049C2/PF00168_30/3_4e08C2/PF00168_30/1_8e13C2/PF00168_30/3_3e03C2/PF00168_30/51C2/PF00168_30/2_9e07NTC2/PF10358_9/2_9NTC2/PF
MPSVSLSPLTQQDVLSPRRSPQHVARVKRSHRFETPFRSVSVEVIEGGEFVHPRDLKITKPLVNVIIGRNAYAMREATRSGNKFEYQSRERFPYSGEPRVRLLVTDSGSHIGFHDINMTLENLKEAWNGIIALHGRRGKSGWLRIGVKPSTTQVEPPPSVYINMEEEGMSPLESTGEPSPTADIGTSPKAPTTTPPQVVSSASSSSSSSSSSRDNKSSSSQSSRTDLTPSAKASQFGSVHVRLHKIEDLAPPKGADFAQKSYVVGKLGKGRLRSQTATVSAGTGSMTETMVFPYNQMRNLRIYVREDKKMKRDETLGRTVVDLDPYLHQGPQKVLLPLENKGTSRGVVQATIEFVDKLETKPRLLETNIDISQIPARSEDSESESGVSEATSAGMNKVSNPTPKSKALRVRVLDARGLKNGTTKKDAPINAYVQARVGTKWLRAKSDKKTGTDPAFHDQLVFPYDSEKHVKVAIYNAMKGRRDPVIGTGKIDLEPLLESSFQRPQIVELPIKGSDGASAGTVRVAVELGANLVKRGYVESYSGAGSREEFEETKKLAAGPNPGTSKTLICTPMAGHDLPKAHRMDTLDPYVVIRYGDTELVGPVAEDAGPNPTFHSAFRFAGAPFEHLRVAVYDRAHLVKDSLVGAAWVELTKVAPASSSEVRNVVLKLKNKKGEVGGKLDLKLQWFDGQLPYGVWTDESAFKDDHALSGVLTPHLGTPSHILGHKIKSFRVRALHAENVAAAAKHPVFLRIGHAKYDVKGGLCDQRITNPTFDDEFVVPYEGERFARVGLYNSGHVSKDTVIGEGAIDLDEYLNQPDSPQTIIVPLADKKEKPSGILTLILTPSSILESHAKNVRHVAATAIPPSLVSGIKWTAVQLEVLSATGLPTSELSRSDIMDPFVVVRYGDEKLRGKTHKNAGRNPQFIDTFLFPFQSRTKLNLEVFDHESLAKDFSLGSGSIDLVSLAEAGEEVLAVEEKSLPLLLNGTTAGTLKYRVSLLEKEKPKKPKRFSREVADVEVESDDDVQEILSKSMGPTVFRSFTLQLLEGEKLASKNPLDKLDPYVIATYGEYKLKTKDYHNAGSNVKFDQGFAFPKAEYRHLKLDVYDKNNMFKDTYIGTGRLDLDQFNSVIQTDRPLTIAIHDKRAKESGVLKCSLSTSPRSIAHPELITRSAGSVQAPISFEAPVAAKENVPPPAVRDLPPPAVSVSRSPDAGYRSMDIELVKLAGLRNPKAKIDTLDPYVTMKFGDEELTGTVMKDAGSNCTVGDLYHFPLDGGQTLRVEVYDRAHMAKDPLLGTAKITLENFLNTDTTTHKLKIPLLNKEGEPEAGFAFIKMTLSKSVGDKANVQLAGKKAVAAAQAAEKQEIGNVKKENVKEETEVSTGDVIDAEDSSHGETTSMIPANGVESIRVQILHCSNVKAAPGAKSLNPYIVGRIGGKTLRTETVKESNGNPIFYEDFVFPYKSTRKVKLTVRNNISMGRDADLGYAKIDLDQFVPRREIQSYTCELFNAETKETNGTLAVRIIPSLGTVAKPVVEERTSAASSISSIEKTEKPATFHCKAFHIDRMRLSQVNPIGTSFDTINPYLETVYGKKDLRSSTCKAFVEVAEFYERHSFATTSANFLKITAFNNIRFGIDKPLGKATLNVAELAKEGGTAKPFRLVLVDKEGRKTGVLEGELMFDDVEVKRGAASKVRQTPKALAPSGNAAKPRGPVQKLAHELNAGSSVSDTDSAMSSAQSADLKANANVVTNAKSFTVEIINGDGLGKTRKNEILQPFVHLRYGRDKLKTRTVVNGGDSAVFGDKCIFPYQSKKFIILTLKDNVKLARDVSVGRAKLNVEDHINRDSAGITELTLKDNSGRSTGVLRVRFIPSTETVSKAEVQATVAGARTKRRSRTVDTASTHGETPSDVSQCPYGSVKIDLVCASNLMNPKAALDTLDPYVVVRFGSTELKGKVNKNGGDDPDFSDTFHFPYVPRRSLRFQVFDKARMTKDPLLGTAKVNLDNFIFSRSETNRLKLSLYDSKRHVAGFLNIKLELLKDTAAKAEATSRTPPKSIAAKSLDVLLKSTSDLKVEGKAQGSATNFVEVRYGDHKLNSALVKSTGKETEVNQKMRFPRSAKLMMFDVRSVESNNTEATVGSGFIDVSSFLEYEGAEKTYSVPLQHDEGLGAGTLTVTLKKNGEKCKEPMMASEHVPYTPKAPLRVSKSLESSSESSEDENDIGFEVPWRSLHLTIESAKGLKSTQIFGGRMDPYIKVRCGSIELQSDPQMNVGSDVNFSTTFSFPYQGESWLRLFVLDYEQWRKDTLSGVAQLNLSPHAKYEGNPEKVVPLEIRLARPKKKDSEAGAMKASLKFAVESVPGPSTMKISVEARTVTAED